MSFIARRHAAAILRPLLQARTAAPRFPVLRSSAVMASSSPSLPAPYRSFHQTALRSEDGAASESGDVTTFKELGTRNLVADQVIATVLDDMKLQNMTPVQVQTINPCLQGLDVIAQAKTGTGKTVGFLLPVIQRILNSQPNLASNQGRRRAPVDIRAIIISPTRELAEQIAVEAKKITRRTGLQVQCAVGGTQKKAHLYQLKREGCHILVGTPGRLQDILSDPSSGVDAPNLDAFVLDEADRLLDQGFGPEIQKIHDQYLPRKDVKDRQTLMFSATMPQEVIHTVRKLMKRDFKFVKTVSDDEVPTHEKVPQKKVQVAGMQNLMPTLAEFVKREVPAGKANERPFKAIVFHNTNAEVMLWHNVLETLTGTRRASYHTKHDRPDAPLPSIPCIEMHSRLSQSQRTRNSEKFRKLSSGIMFSSDVSARGMDFPNVTHVIQIGLPSNSENYVHRIGRTGRGDKTGEAWIFLSPIEVQEARSRLRGFPIEDNASLQAAQVDMTQDGQIPAGIAEILTATLDAAKSTDIVEKSNAYRSMLGVFTYVRSKATLVEQMNNLTKYCWGMETPPGLDSNLVKKLGFSGVPGINTGYRSRDENAGEFSSRGSGRDGFSDRGGGRGQFGGGRTSDRAGGRGGYGGDRGSRGGFGGDRESRGGFGGDRGSRGGYGGNRGSRGGFGGRGSRNEYAGEKPAFERRSGRDAY